MELFKELENEKKRKEQFLLEADKINVFWVYECKRLENMQSEYRNKLRELEDLKEKHQIETKV